MADEIHFENAPLEEVVCGIQFTGIKWSDIHFGLFFAKLGGRYDQTQRHNFTSLFDQSQPSIRFETEPKFRFWYESATSPFLLQIQEDAFFLNWRRQSDTFAYPHFRTRGEGDEGVWDHFIYEWEVFCNFCEEQKIGTPEVLACHLSYINHMIHGESWDPVDLVKLLRPAEGLKELDSLTRINMSISYTSGVFPIRINIRPAIRKDQKRSFIVEFIITDKLSNKNSNSISNWFEESHKIVVQEFLKQTTEEAHKRWGLSYG